MMKRLLTLLVSAGLVLTANLAMAGVENSPHDLRGGTLSGTGGTGVHSAGANEYGLCEICHVPHAASTSTNARLWREAASITKDTTWAHSTVGALCATCHDGGALALIEGHDRSGLPGGANCDFGPAIDQSDKVYRMPFTSGAVDDNQGSHKRNWNTLTVNVAPGYGIQGHINDKQSVVANTNGKPYTNGTKIETNLIECTSCHNPHQDGQTAGGGKGYGGTGALPGIRPFLRAGSISATTTGGTISQHCADCHANRYNTGLGPNNPTNEAGVTDNVVPGASMHPIDVAYTDSAVNGGATLKRPFGAGMGLRSELAHTIDADRSWSLGGKFQQSITDSTPLVAGSAGPSTSNAIGCQTCHAIHNPQTGGREEGLHLLAVNNLDVKANLCEGCHGDPTGSSGVNMGKWPYEVGTTPGDHPIDTTIGIGLSNVVIDLWYDATSPTRTGQTFRLERSNAGTETWWPRGYAVVGTLGTVQRTIICTSCHSAHRGREAAGFTAMVGGSVVVKGGKLRRFGHRTKTTAEKWCESCHGDPSPRGHHSNVHNDTAAIATDSPIPNTNGLTIASAIDCSDCHGNGKGGSAHNGGFLYYGTFANSNQGNVNSELCEYCHLASGNNATSTTYGIGYNWKLATPVYAQTGGNPYNEDNDPVIAAPVNDYLWGDGSVMGGMNTTFVSHYLGTFNTGVGTGVDLGHGINIKTGYWQDGFSYYGTAVKSYSKYGGTANNDPLNATNSHGRAAPTLKTRVICESCHSILYNIGASGNYNGGAGPTKASGWANNLLLQDYRDDTSANGRDTASIASTGVGFCIACHNKSQVSGGVGRGSLDTFAADVVTNATVGAGATVAKNTVPPDMHPMTGWTITRARDVGRTPTTLITAGSAPNATYADKNTITAGGVIWPYPTDDKMNCDSCHRPHMANGRHTPLYSSKSVPVILEDANGALPAAAGMPFPGVITNGSNSKEYDKLCQDCHQY